MSRYVFVIAYLVIASNALAADPSQVIPHRQKVQPNHPYSPAEALARMTVPDGFTVELVASEPDVVNPIAMTFDDRGRIWITESVEYPRKPAGRGRDRIKILEDTTGDGRADKVTVFADGLNIPSGIAVGYGGVWVINAPDLLFMKEKDGREISREVVVTGFGRTDTHELPSCLTWGPDGFLYGLNGVFNHCQITSAGRDYKFNCALYRIDPRTHRFELFCEGTSNPWGLVWDPDGSAIVSTCHWANDHVFHFVETGYYQRQAGAYPPYTMKIGSISDHSHQMTAYCGLAYLDSDAYPPQYRDRLYMGNIHGGCINVDVLRADGSTYISSGEPDFMTANDVWFMPVAQKVGPDGCLYVLDWYDRYHCAQDAKRDPEGVDRLKGRLYRVRYKNSPRAPTFDLDKESDEQLVARLHSPNIYFRETAQRLLSERNTQTIRTRLAQLVLDSDAPRKARLHGLWALVGTGSLELDLHLALLRHSDSTYRAWGVRAAGNYGDVAPRIRTAVIALARDSAQDVQLQVAIAARKIDGADPLAVLVDVLAHCGHDKLIPSIVWPNLHPLLENDSARFAQLVNAVDLRAAPGLAELLPRAVDRILGASEPDFDSLRALVALTVRQDEPAAKECMTILSTRFGSLPKAFQTQLRSVLDPVLTAMSARPDDDSLRLSAQLLAARLNPQSIDARSIRSQFTSANQSEDVRLSALEALIISRDSELLEAVDEVLSSGSTRWHGKVLATLGHLDDRRLAKRILARYAGMEPELQPLAVDLLMQREHWARKLLIAVRDKKIPSTALNANHLRRILESNDREAIWIVEATWGNVRAERHPEREQVVTEMGKYLRENLGDPIAGEAAFKKLCAQCHVIHGQGYAVGPDLTGNGRASFDQLLSNVFDPSLVIGPGYQLTTVVTGDGRILTGLVTEDNAQRIVLKLQGGQEETIARGNVEHSRVSKLSMMPEGVEVSYDRRELADLFAFLSYDKHPSDPTAQLILGAPGRRQERRIRLEAGDQKLIVQTRQADKSEWTELVTFVTNPALRPYLHPVYDPSGQFVLTEDQPDDHPWQHGIFTGFHAVNGANYWKEDQGRQRFVRLLSMTELDDRVSWKSLSEWVAPSGQVVVEEEQTTTVHTPESLDTYTIDIDLTLRAKNRDVKFGKFFVGGLSVRLEWEPDNPRQKHLTSTGLRGLKGEQKRAAWCTVDRPYGEATYGVAVFDHPSNPNHPPGWRIDREGLINPNVSALGDWTIPAGAEQTFHYRLVIYKGRADREAISRRFDIFTAEAASEPTDASGK